MSKQQSNWQKFCNSVEGKNTTRQLAAGVVFGMLIGLIPKDSLLIIVSTVILVLSPANLLTAAISAIVFSLVGTIPPLNAAIHSMGIGILGQASLEATFRSWWSLPLVPWTRINNSIVVGAIALWAILLVPVYWSSWIAFDRFGDRVDKFVRDSQLFCWLTGARKTKLNEG